MTPIRRTNNVCIAGLAGLLFLGSTLKGERLVYPQAAVGPLTGGTFEIELRLGNKSESEWRGEVRLLRQQDLQGMPNLSFVDSEGSTGNIPNGTLPVVIPPEGSQLYKISSDSLQVGVMAIEPNASSAIKDLVASFYYRLVNKQGRATDLIAIQGVSESHTGYRLMLSSLPTFNVGVAVVAEKSLGTGPQGATSTEVELIAVLEDGTQLAGKVELGGGEDLQKALFPNSVIQDLSTDVRVAQLKIRSNDAIYLATLAVGTPPEFDDVQIGAAPADADVDIPFTNLQVNTQDRSEVVTFWNTFYKASEGVAVESTGDEKSCFPGMTSDVFKESILRQINFFRAMAGVPADVVFDSELNDKCQQMALMMVANNRSSHNPDPSWECYTEEGAEAAAKSNLFYLGQTKPTATSIIDGYVRDSGQPNTAAGHRRLTLRSIRQWKAGSGTVQTSEDSANALYVLGDFGTVLRMRSSWPPPGYVPFRIVYERWSFSFPDADFSNATVTMSQNGQPVDLTIEPVAIGFGDNSIVWVPAVLAETPVLDITFQVTVGNVIINGVPQEFSYGVIVMDPDQ